MRFVRLRLEALEDRTSPAVFDLTGSLPPIDYTAIQAAIAAAAATPPPMVVPPATTPAPAPISALLDPFAPPPPPAVPVIPIGQLLPAPIGTPVGP